MHDIVPFCLVTVAEQKSMQLSIKSEAKSEANFNEIMVSSHPMISVPEAIRIALTITASNHIFNHQQQQQHQQHDVDNNNNKEHVNLLESTTALLGRRLAEHVVMPAPGYPSYRASIMDGYAISKVSDQYRYEIVDKIYAGQQSSAHNTNINTNNNDTAAYVTTGAVVPNDCIAVVPIEACTIVDDDEDDKKYVVIDKDYDISSNDWIRAVGCDIQAGEVVLSAGSVIDPASVGLLHQVGVTSICVYKPTRVGVLSTGNELQSLIHSQTANTTTDTNASTDIGKIPDANRPMLLALLHSWSPVCEAIDLGVARDDDPDALAHILDSAQCDIIITTGGISTGELDIMERVLVGDRLHGKLHFGRLHMKPGKPTTMVTLPASSTNNNTRTVFALPGNPVSAIVCCHLLVRPCLDFIYDCIHNQSVSLNKNADSNTTNDIKAHIEHIVANARLHSECIAVLTHDKKLDIERPEYCRVTLNRTKSGGTYTATSTGVQRSSRLLSMRNADALLVLPQATETYQVAKSGQEFVALRLSYTHSSEERPTVQQSRHLSVLNRPSVPFRVGLVRIVNENDDTEEAIGDAIITKAVTSALNDDTTNTAAKVVYSKKFTGSPNDLYDFVVSNYQSTEESSSQATVDIHIIAMDLLHGSFVKHVQCANALSSRITKVADNVALQARLAVSRQSSLAALFEIVVGYGPADSLVAFIPAQHAYEALSSIKSVLKHALISARQ